MNVCVVITVAMVMSIWDFEPCGITFTVCVYRFYFAAILKGYRAS
jgi:hypothetical protein